MLVLSRFSIASSSAFLADFGFFGVRDMSSSPFAFFLLPIVVAVGRGSGEGRRAGSGACVGEGMDDCSGASNNERERFGDGTGVRTGDSER